MTLWRPVEAALAAETGAMPSKIREDGAADWTVLLIGGNSGAGKTMVAEELSRRTGVAHVPSDVLNGLSVRPLTEAELRALVGGHPNPAMLLARLIAAGDDPRRALEVFVADRLEHDLPAIVEGVFVEPAFAARREFGGAPVAPGRVRAAFLVEKDEEAILGNMVARGRVPFLAKPAADRWTVAQASRRSGQRMQREAEQLGLPVIPAQPRTDSAARLAAALGIEFDGGTARLKIDAVLPLVKRDHKRFERLLLPSMQHFLEALGTCWVVVPRGEQKALRRRITDPRFVVLTADDVLPELPKAKARRTSHGRESSGWMVQQLLKLSIARAVSTPFYLTLDADVICLKPIHYETLVHACRGIANVSDEESHVRPVTPHAQAYRLSGQLLGFSGPVRTHGLTPAVLSTTAVLDLLAVVEERAGLMRKRAEAFLLKNPSWTETTLYYTFLEQKGLFDTYHFPAAESAYGNTIWRRWDGDAWDPAVGFSDSSDCLFSVLQGDDPNLKIKRILKSIRSYYRSIGEHSPF